MSLCQKAVKIAQAVIRDEITILGPDDLHALTQGAGATGLPPDLLAHMTLRNRVRKIGIFSNNCAAQPPAPDFSGLGAVA